MEYVIICAMICCGFLSKYYTAGSMRIRESEESDQVQMTLDDAEELLHDLFNAVKGIVDTNTPFLSAHHKCILQDTCCAICESSIDEELRYERPSEENDDSDVKTQVTMEMKILSKYGE